jgi:hypothetical protein
MKAINLENAIAYAKRFLQEAEKCDSSNTSLGTSSPVLRPLQPSALRWTSPRLWPNSDIRGNECNTASI